MLDQGQIDALTFAVLRTTANILDDFDPSDATSRECFEKAEAAVRASKLLIRRSDTLIEQLNHDLVQSVPSSGLTPDESGTCASEDRQARRTATMP
jgi:hypothetical protein